MTPRDDDFSPIPVDISDQLRSSLELAEEQAEQDKREHLARQAAHRDASVELVSEMLAGAGFDLVNHDPRAENGALWIQELPSRPSIQVLMTLTNTDLLRPPAELYKFVHDQVGG
jgi:hypothetical protein